MICTAQKLAQAITNIHNILDSAIKGLARCGRLFLILLYKYRRAVPSGARMHVRLLYSVRTLPSTVHYVYIVVLG